MDYKNSIEHLKKQQEYQMEQMNDERKNLFDAFKFWRAAAFGMLVVAVITLICTMLEINKIRLAATKTELDYQTKLESVERIRDLAVEQLGGMAQKVEELEAELDALRNAQTEVQSMDILAGGQYVSLGEFKLTAYCPCEKCCGKWANGITASGQVAEPGMIAVDPKIISLGSTVVIDGKEYLAADTGGAIKGNRIDVYFEHHSEALAFGVQTADVWLAEP